MGNKTHFVFNKYILNQIKVPNSYQISVEGDLIKIEDFVKDKTNIECQYQDNLNNFTLIFNIKLKPSELKKVQEAVNEYKIKNIYTNIEKNVINWFNNKNKKSSDLDKLLTELETEYKSLSWESFSLQDKKILARWFVVEESKRLEVFTKEQLDNYKFYKIYRYLNDNYINIDKDIIRETPLSVDIKTDTRRALNPNEEYKNGFVEKEKYYARASVLQDSTTLVKNYIYEDLLMVIENINKIGSDKFLTRRIIQQRWVYSDETLSEKIRNGEVVYSSIQALREAGKARENVTKQIIAETIGIILMTEPEANNLLEAELIGRPWVKEISIYIYPYHEYGELPDGNGGYDSTLIEAVDNTPTTEQDAVNKGIENPVKNIDYYPWLDNIVPGTNPQLSIKQYISYKLKRLD